jgi:hypothetical protein
MGLFSDGVSAQEYARCLTARAMLQQKYGSSLAVIRACLDFVRTYPDHPAVPEMMEAMREWDAIIRSDYDARHPSGERA